MFNTTVGISHCRILTKCFKIYIYSRSKCWRITDEWNKLKREAYQSALLTIYAAKVFWRNWWPCISKTVRGILFHLKFYFCSVKRPFPLHIYRKKLYKSLKIQRKCRTTCNLSSIFWNNPTYTLEYKYNAICNILRTIIEGLDIFDYTSLYCVL